MTIRKFSSLFLLISLGACNLSEVYAAPQAKPDGKGDKVKHRMATVPNSAAPIIYHGGPVMVAGVHLYYIWYGNWTGNTAKTILTDFANNIGGSNYFNINTYYYQTVNGPRQYVSGAVHLVNSITDNYSQGTSLTDAQVQVVVSSALASGALPSDSSGIYFVLTSSDVNETSGFCTSYCGWHDVGTIAGSNIRYSFVGNPDRCPNTCEQQTGVSPNGNPGADGMASVIAHELCETVTDPNLDAWYDDSVSPAQENGDKCAWDFGMTQTLPNGSHYNIMLGGRPFLIQQMWQVGGGCALSAPPPPKPPTGLTVTVH